MSNIKITDANQQLPELVKRASQSREVIMLRDEGKIEAVLGASHICKKTLLAIPHSLFPIPKKR